MHCSPPCWGVPDLYLSMGVAFWLDQAYFQLRRYHEVQALDHRGRQRGLRGYLPVPDRDGLVMVGGVDVAGGGESGALRRVNHLEYAVIADASQTGSPD